MIDWDWPEWEARVKAEPESMGRFRNERDVKRHLAHLNRLMIDHYNKRRLFNSSSGGAFDMGF